MVEDPLKEAVYFGFQTVDVSEKTKRVQDVFHRVSGRYDVMNDAMSLGLHRIWKDTFVNQIPLGPGFSHIDMAGGTGDITRRLVKRAIKQNLRGRILLADLNPSMLFHAQLPLEAPAYVKSVCMNAERLACGSHLYDSYTIAFGLRNVTDQKAALREALRTLKPGGVFMCLEFSKVQSPFWGKLYDLYTLQVVPKMGKVIAHDEAAYRYLGESIERFHRPDVLAELMEEVGFSSVSYQLLTGGVVAIHTGWKPLG